MTRPGNTLEQEGIEPRLRRKPFSTARLEDTTPVKKKAIFHCKTGGYNPYHDALHQLPRHQQTIIFRLRTGHCRLNSHLKRIGVKTSAQCPCGEADQTEKHYLHSCSLYHQARQQIWPTCVSLETKLWGSAEDLFLTSKYAVLMGGSSRRDHHIERRRFVPDIQVCGTHGREDLVDANITSNAEDLFLTSKYAALTGKRI